MSLDSSSKRTKPPRPRTSFDKAWDFVAADPLRAVGTGAAIGAAALVGFALSRYHVCRPDQILVRTGLGITDMTISKTGLQMPFQRAFVLSMKPTTSRFNLTAMSEEFLEVEVPVDIVAKPFHPTVNEEAFKDFARYLSNDDATQVENFQDVMSAVLEGRFRTLVANRKIEQIFHGEGRSECNDAILNALQREMRPFGIDVTSAQVRELHDKKDASGKTDPKSAYFDSLKLKAVKSAEFVADADVARTQREMEVEVAQNKTHSRIKVAQFNMEAAVKENERSAEIALSEAVLAEATAASEQRKAVANVQADVAERQRRAELETSLHDTERGTQEQLLRSQLLAEVVVAKESAVVEAEGVAAAMRLRADAELYQAEQQATGTRLQMEAQADGFLKMQESYAANPALAVFYMGDQSGLWDKLGGHSAQALQGMEPKINVVQHPGNDAIMEIVSQFMPIVSMFKSQTGDGGMFASAPAAKGKTMTTGC
jgi:flotillin